MIGPRVALLSLLILVAARADPPRLVITEVMTAPRFEFGCYVEIHNLGPTPAPIDGLCLRVRSRMIELAPFDRDAPAEIPPDGFAIVLEGGYTEGYDLPRDAVRLRDAGLVAGMEAGSTIAVCYRDGEVLSAWRNVDSSPAPGEAWTRSDPALEGTRAGWQVSARTSPGRRNRFILEYFTQPGVPDSAIEDALIAQIDAASESIDVAVYELDRPSIVEALLRAAERLGPGAVRLVTEFHQYAKEDSAATYARIEAAGIDVVTDLDGASRLMHHKFFVFDRKRTWTGSLNLTDRAFHVQPNDVVLVHSSEVARAFHQEFEELFAGVFGNHKVDDGNHVFDVEGVKVEVYFAPSDPVRQRILDAVKGARESIDLLINHLTDMEIAQALAERSRAGVRVRIVFDRQGATKSKSRELQALLADAGVSYRLWGDTQRFMHSKCAVIDAEGGAPHVVTGSFNYSIAASKENDESLVVVHGKDVASAYVEYFLGVWSEGDAPADNE